MTAKLKPVAVVEPTPEDRAAFARWLQIQADLHGLALGVRQIEGDGADDEGLVAETVFCANALCDIGRRLRATASQIWAEHQTAFDALWKERERRCQNTHPWIDDLFGDREGD